MTAYLNRFRNPKVGDDQPKEFDIDDIAELQLENEQEILTDIPPSTITGNNLGRQETSEY